ncbi:bestrophin-like domain [Xanthobacter pseudotagetidis]|uniref:bestrophin-like domain n=1 Tax=Xanthobacter pseudotagetidis TaxID=3119911 RepID=UPI00372CB073
MGFVLAIAETSVLAFGLILFLAQMGAHGIGFWVGRRDAMREVNPEAVGVIVGGILGLLAFVLALTLSFANSRFSEHRQGSIAEANTIGTAWLRAKAIGNPRGEAIASLIEDYVQVRADFVRATRDPAELDVLNRRTNALQSQMWGHLSVVVREQPNPVSTALMSALNDMFDAGTSERFAYHITLPPQLFWLLIGMTLISMGCLGYQFGLKKRASLALVVVLTLMWTWVVVEILDLASARLGYIRTGTAVYDWTIQGFKGGVTIPALPQ